MSDTDRETLSRLLTEHGTSGVAEELASICRERARTDEDRLCTAGLWNETARQFDSIA